MHYDVAKIFYSFQRFLIYIYELTTPTGIYMLNENKHSL